MSFLRHIQKQRFTREKTGHNSGSELRVTLHSIINNHRNVPKSISFHCSVVTLEDFRSRHKRQITRTTFGNLGVDSGGEEKVEKGGKNSAQNVGKKL